MKKLLICFSAVVLCLCFSCGGKSGKVNKEEWKEAFERVELKKEAETSSFVAKNEHNGFHATQMDRDNENTDKIYFEDFYSVPGTTVIVEKRKGEDGDSVSLRRYFASGKVGLAKGTIDNGKVNWDFYGPSVIWHGHDAVVGVDSTTAQYMAYIKGCKDFCDASNYNTKSKSYTIDCFMCMDWLENEFEVRLDIPVGWTEQNQDEKRIYDCVAEVSFVKDENGKKVLDELNVDYKYHYGKENLSSNGTYDGTLNIKYAYPEDILGEVPAAQDIAEQLENAKTEADIYFY